MVNKKYFYFETAKEHGCRGKIKNFKKKKEMSTCEPLETHHD